MFSREPLSVSACSGGTSAWGNIQPESEIMRMLITASWKPEVMVDRPRDPDNYFRTMNEIISSLRSD